MLVFSCLWCWCCCLIFLQTRKPGPRELCICYRTFFGWNNFNNCIEVKSFWNYSALIHFNLYTHRTQSLRTHTSIFVHDAYYSSEHTSPSLSVLFTFWHTILKYNKKSTCRSTFYRFKYTRSFFWPSENKTFFVKMNMRARTHMFGPTKLQFECDKLIWMLK